MKQISAPSYRISLYWIAIIGLFVAIASIGGAIISSSEFLLVIPVSAVLLYGLWRASNSVCNVFDCGEFLLIRKGDREVTVPLSNISKIESFDGRHPFVRISLYHPCDFGASIDFQDAVQRSGNPFCRVVESDALIAVRARIENTTVEALRAQQKKWAHPWAIYVIGALIAWSIIDSPAGPMESFSCTVLNASPMRKNTIKLTLSMSDGTVVEVSAKKSYPIGAKILCTRQRHRVTRGFSYECE